MSFCQSDITSLPNGCSGIDSKKTHSYIRTSHGSILRVDYIDFTATRSHIPQHCFTSSKHHISTKQSKKEQSAVRKANKVLEWLGSFGYSRVRGRKEGVNVLDDFVVAERRKTPTGPQKVMNSNSSAASNGSRWKKHKEMHKHKKQNKSESQKSYKHSKHKHHSSNSEEDRKITFKKS